MRGNPAPLLQTKGGELDMTGKISITVPITQSEYEILKTLDEHCFMVAELKALVGRKLLINIEAFTMIGGDEDIN